jgi:methylglutaconyl-CoA hydratase
MKSILVEHPSNGIAQVILNRPHKHNALDDNLIKLLITELTALEHDKNVKIIVLTANGKNFSAGADLAWMKRMISSSEEENFADAIQWVTLLKTLFNITKPILALPQGITLGGGVGLLACCDIVIAEKDARFCFAEAKIGLVPATIAPYVIQAIGPRAARYYFLTAKIFGTAEAQRIGLVHEMASAQDLLTTGMALALSLLKNGPNALREIKRLVLRCNLLDETFLKETAALIARVRVSKEGQEGLSAFLEKREPRWNDRD